MGASAVSKVLYFDFAMMVIMESKTSVDPGFVRRPRRLWDFLNGISVVVAFWEAVFDDFDEGFADDFDFVIFETIDRRNFVRDGKKSCFEKRIFMNSIRQ